MKIILLTHERELTRKTNTGQLALNLFPEICTRLIWSRVEPDNALLALIAKGQAKLLFPSANSAGDVQYLESQRGMAAKEIVDGTLPDWIIILDATWQEAKKMYRQSDYLKNAPTIALKASKASQYTLRRNQLDNGLCTAECVATLLEQNNQHDQAELLMQSLIEHCQF
ncbi:DTW domain-containing protein [Shewanella gelidii]|nr:DTW domain-containing protein [Shewanella gelidii]